MHLSVNAFIFFLLVAFVFADRAVHFRLNSAPNAQTTYSLVQGVSSVKDVFKCAKRCLGYKNCDVFAIENADGAARQCELFMQAGEVVDGAIRYGGALTSPTINDFQIYKAFQQSNEQVGTSPSQMAKDCSEIYSRGYNTSGVYEIRPNAAAPAFKVMCDMDDGDAGWTVIHKRFDGSVQFELRDWQGYKNFFGDVNGEYWSGLEQIYQLTQLAVGSTTLKFDLWDSSDNYAFSQYGNFYLDNEASGYKLNVGSYNGASTATEEMISETNGMKWSSTDVDNDNIGINCASSGARQGGWWFNGCGGVNLNGPYNPGVDAVNGANYWRGYPTSGYVGLKASTMKLKRVV